MKIVLYTEDFRLIKVESYYNKAGIPLAQT